MKTELFQSVHNKAEYINFEYTLNWQTLYFALFLPAIPYQAYTLARMCYMYCNSKSKATLHLVPFTSLMMMGYSVSNLQQITLIFVVSRICFFAFLITSFSVFHPRQFSLHSVNRVNQTNF